MSEAANNTCPRLIEVALPIREISAESVRDKSLRHGHISTLHLWWARRPLAASRAVVFASLVPDPDDPRCPADFRAAVERQLKTHVPAELKYYRRGREVYRDEDPYRPYLPAEASAQAGEGMPDTLRNRLLMFIAKWSPEYLEFEAGKAKKAPDPKYLLDDRSLVKWETSDPENAQGREVLRVARELVKIAHGGRVPVVLDPFAGGGAIPLEAGRLGCQPIANDYNPVAYLILRATCEFPQRYRKPGRRELPIADRRLPIFESQSEIENPQSKMTEVPNVLVHDVETWANWILERARERIGHLYPCLPAGRLRAPEKWEAGTYYVYALQCSDGTLYKGHTDDIPRRLREHDQGMVDWTAPRRPVYLVYWEAFGTRQEAVDREKWLKSGEGREWLRQTLGEPEKVVGYLWARTAPCSNPSCRGEIPLLRSLLVCDKRDRKVALTMEVEKKRKTVRFGVAEGNNITRTEGTTVSRGAQCPICKQITDVDRIKEASFSGNLGERIVAVITEGRGGKDYRPVEETDIQGFQQAKQMLDPQDVPNEPMPDSPDLVSGRGWNFRTWGSLFNPRQLVAMQTFVACLHEALAAMKKDIEDLPAPQSDAARQAGDECRKAVGVYLGLWVSRSSMFQSNVGLWKPSGEFVAAPFSMQAIPMVWDYPETSLFADASGGAGGQLDWIKRFIIHESNNVIPASVTRGDGAALAIRDDSVDVVVTDPPYFDAIAYGDLSDFFYVWLKRGLGDVIPEALVTPLTPKADEATALKHRHQGDAEKADAHFKSKLAAVLAEAHRVLKPDGIISVMFAHQSTKAWTALIQALFDAGLSIDATWPIDTEREVRSVALGSSALASSITVICRARTVRSASSFKDVRKEIQEVVAEAVKRFWSYGFRGADLIVACYGPAVGVFGKYERVEKADGTPVGIPELLELAKQAARDAIAGEFRGDNLSTLYYVWANLYGASEQAWDDARLVVQIGGDEDNAMEVARGHGIFVVDGSKCRLALLEDRADRRGLGIDQNPPHIDALHHSMLLWKQEKRKELVGYLGERDLLEDGPFWKLAQALFEVLPRDLEDWKLVNALLGERQTLRAEGKSTAYRDAQQSMFGEEV